MITKRFTTTIPLASLLFVLATLQGDAKNPPEASLTTRSSNVEEFAQDFIKEGVAYQSEKHGFAGDDPVLLRKTEIPFNPSQWTDFYNRWLSKIRLHQDSNSAILVNRAAYFRFVVGPWTGNRSEAVMPFERAWQLLLPADYLYWHNGRTWHVNVFLENGNSSSGFHFFHPAGTGECLVLEEWPNRIAGWMGWAEGREGIQRFPAKLNGKSFVAIAIPKALVSLDVREVSLLRDLEFPEKLVNKTREEEGPTQAGRLAFALGEQLWPIRDITHIETAVSLFKLAAEEFKEGKEPTLEVEAKCRLAATLRIAAYAYKAFSLFEGDDAVANAKRAVQSKQILKQAVAIENEVGSDVFDKELSAELYASLGQNAGPVERKDAAMYFAKALSASPPLTGLNRSYVLIEHAVANKDTLPTESLLSDLSEAEKLLAPEEKSVSKKIKDTVGEVDSFKFSLRPDLSETAETCQFQRKLIEKYRKEFESKKGASANPARNQPTQDQHLRRGGLQTLQGNAGMAPPDRRRSKCRLDQAYLRPTLDIQRQLPEELPIV
jgi:hypothetical protein